jgi:hypothetical protein
MFSPVAPSLLGFLAEQGLRLCGSLPESKKPVILKPIDSSVPSIG